MISFQRGETVELLITDYAFGGKGIAKVPTEEGFYPVFVEHAYPGQKVLARITAKRKRHAEGNLVKVLERAAIEQSLDLFDPNADHTFALWGGPCHCASGKLRVCLSMSLIQTSVVCLALHKVRCNHR
jgi:predicted RNA-binding protein with TRAM domain